MYIYMYVYIYRHVIHMFDEDIKGFIELAALVGLAARSVPFR
jgi:hypothetical protein